MIKKILIANRGEIACRVIRTARKLNINTIAVYSDADKDSLFVKQADESYYIGGSQPAESYLDINKIINIAKKSKADAVHPGYGFLSENAAFVKRLAKEKIKFIGPNPNAIKKMGDKIESKNLAIKLKLNVIPGHTAPVKNSKEALKISNKIGYPVLLKASAGGGGKGMRIVRKNSELEEDCKVNHLSYIGDSIIGSSTNIGAGTITANFDGQKKHQTKIGKNSSIGANTVFVAPINLGESVTTGAGSVITKDSKDNSLAISRTKQVNIENWERKKS